MFKKSNKDPLDSVGQPLNLEKMRPVFPLRGGAENAHCEIWEPLPCEDKQGQEPQDSGLPYAQVEDDEFEMG